MSHDLSRAVRRRYAHDVHCEGGDVEEVDDQVDVEHVAAVALPLVANQRLAQRVAEELLKENHFTHWQSVHYQ